VSDARRRITRLFLLSAPVTWWIFVNVAGCGRSVGPANDSSGPAEAPVTQPQPEERGKAIYLRGQSPSGVDIKAVVGDGGEIPASLLACVNCHGRSGRSKSEGGITPSVLAWEVLTRPYGTRQPGGREHPPYDERSLVRAITLGIDSGGRRLLPSMPRYRLSQADAADVVAYIKKLGDEHDPGLAQDSIRVGVVSSSTRGLPATGDPVVRAALTAYFGAINSQGGIFGRQIELQFVELACTTDSHLDELRAALDARNIFALVGSRDTDDDDAIALVAEKLGIPVIGLISRFPQETQTPNRYVFYLTAGLVDQGLAFLDHAVAQPPGQPGRLVVLHRDEPAYCEVAARLCEASRGSMWDSVESKRISAGSVDSRNLARELQKAGVGHVIVLAHVAELRELVAQADEVGWGPTFLAPFALVGTDILDLPTSRGCRVLVTHPALLPRQIEADGTGVPGFAEIMIRPVAERTHAFAALASAVVFVEGLKRSGKEVNRDSLVDALEGLSRFQTGLTPPLTFGRSRHVGSRGSYLLSADLASKELRSMGWIEPQDHSARRTFP
jgi:ABC-type branched-subunit amino acid transport system substrate-binding protein